MTASRWRRIRRFDRRRHDLPQSAREASLAILAGGPAHRQPAVQAIEAHSFSSGVEPDTLGAQILQDADRRDANGALGIARCFYVAGRMGSGLYPGGLPPRADVL